MRQEAPRQQQIGIRANTGQFALLILTNVFVGGMIGVERTVLPLLAEQKFGLGSHAVAVSFLVSFGLAKAFGNLTAGQMSDRWGRKRVLIGGWLAGLPAPLILAFAPDWGWVLVANLFLGANQALCWSVTLVMKIDLAGADRRGVATAANEWAGYIGIALAALVTGYLAGLYAPQPAPFYLGTGIALTGLLLSAGFIRETQVQARSTEARVSARALFWRVSWVNPSLRAVNQAGLATNLKDGLMWGFVPVFLSSQGMSLSRIGIVAAVYPAVWGFCQLATGPLSDRWGRKWFIVAGMLLQAAGIGWFMMSGSFSEWIAAASVIGMGTAAVYPTLLAAVVDLEEARWRASALGIYRLWRDFGYVVAGCVIGVLADAAGSLWTLGLVAGTVFVSGLLVAWLMVED